MKIPIIITLLTSTVAMANEPELSCDFQHQCYHMDPTHPDKVTPPPAPQYPPPKQKVAPREVQPELLAPATPPVEPEALVPRVITPTPGGYNPYPDCFNMRRGLFDTREAVANARAHCGD